MTQEESIKLLALIKLAYPNSYKDIDKDTQIATVNMWRRAFIDTPFCIVEMALDSFVRESKFPPTIADITERLQSIHDEATLNFLSTGDGQRREAYRYIMNATERYIGRNENIIHPNMIENLLKGDGQLLLGS